MPSPSQRLGAGGEAEAEAYLVHLGYSILDRHYTCRFGELDLIAAQDQRLIFVEVRLRRSRRFGSPEESFSSQKLERLAAAIETYRNAHPELLAWPYQLDVIVIDRTTNPPLRHLPAVSLES